MEDKIWFIKIEDNQEGPFSVLDLKYHPRMTPDTLVWKEGFTKWVPARKVPELKSLFKDEEEPVELKDRFKIRKVSQEDSILALEGSNFPYLFYWLIILLIIVIYFFYKFHGPS